MKLIKAHVMSDVEHAIEPALWKQIIMGPSWTQRNTEYITTPELFDYPVIEFDSPVALGMKIDRVDLGYITYHGVLPTWHVEGDAKTAKCHFDYFTVYVETPDGSNQESNQ